MLGKFEEQQEGVARVRTWGELKEVRLSKASVRFSKFILRAMGSQ